MTDQSTLTTSGTSETGGALDAQGKVQTDSQWPLPLQAGLLPAGVRKCLGYGN